MKGCEVKTRKQLLLIERNCFNYIRDIHTYIYTYVYIYIYIYIYIYTHTHTCICTYVIMYLSTGPLYLSHQLI